MVVAGIGFWQHRMHTKRKVLLKEMGEIKNLEPLVRRVEARRESLTSEFTLLQGFGSYGVAARTNEDGSLTILIKPRFDNYRLGYLYNPSGFSVNDWEPRAPITNGWYEFY
jgi:hypothetical protein